MRCPFCQIDMNESRTSDNHQSLYCESENCLIEGDMPRYGVYMNSHKKLVTETYYLEPYYVQVSHEDNVTVISLLKTVILIDSIIVPRAIGLNYINMSDTLKKIKTLMVFS